MYSEALDALKTVRSSINYLIWNEDLGLLGQFCDSFATYVSNKTFEVTRDENLLNGLRILKEKIAGLQDGHGVFLQVAVLFSWEVCNGIMIRW